MRNRCTSFAGQFDSNGGAPVQYGAHCLIQLDQGYYTGSHWVPPSGDYLLRIVPAAARVTANKTMMANALTLLAILMAMAVRQYYTTCIT